jgi:hypothetical protein
MQPVVPPGQNLVVVDCVVEHPLLHREHLLVGVLQVEVVLVALVAMVVVLSFASTLVACLLLPGGSHFRNSPCGPARYSSQIEGELTLGLPSTPSG